jgi:hypothetical protein
MTGRPLFDRRLELKRLGVDPDARAPAYHLNPELDDPRHRNSEDAEKLGQRIRSVAALKGIPMSEAADLVLRPQQQEEDPDEHDDHEGAR